MAIQYQVVYRTADVGQTLPHLPGVDDLEAIAANCIEHAVTAEVFAGGRLAGIIERDGRRELFGLTT